MSLENVIKFYEALDTDETLGKQLTAVFELHRDEPLDSAAAARLIAEEILPLAAKHGMPFLLVDLKRHEAFLWHSLACACASSNPGLPAAADR